MATENTEMKKATICMLSVAATGALAYALAKKLRGAETCDSKKSWIDACDEATRNLQLKLETFQKAS
jgi:hypothetical protein